MKNIKSIIIILFSVLNIQASEIYKNEVKHQGIRSVQLYRKGWPLGFPILELNKSHKLILSFDDLNNEGNDYTYKIVHCNYDWTQSDLSESEYLDGINENDLNEGEPSFHTFYNYTNYTSEFPTEDIRITKSGNYALIVYKNYNTDEVVFTRRFYVLEEKAFITPKIERAHQSEFSDTKQQVELKISFDNVGNLTPETLKVLVSQNNDPNSSKYFSKPFIKGDIYEYIDIDEILFDAGNEYRYADLKDTKYKNLNVSKIGYDNRYYHYYLLPDNDRSFKEYYTNSDLNGNYYIINERADNSAIEADYVYLHYYLKSFPVDANQKIYVYGAFSNWELSDDYVMHYNYKGGYYEATTLQKQGAYNYKYVLTTNGKADFNHFSGNYYQTENDYVIYVYCKSEDDRYDRFIGFKKSNSIKVLK